MRFAVKTTALTLAIALALVVTGCAKKDVAATVNGQEIKNSEVEAQLAQIKKQYPTMFNGADGEAREADFRNRIIDNLINLILIEQAAEKENIKVSDKEIDERYNQLRKNFSDEAAFKDALTKAGLDEDTLRDQLKAQALTQALIEKLAKDIKIDEKEIKTYYEQNRDQFKQEAGVHAAHIMFDKDDQELANNVLEQVEDGGDFTALAKKYSSDKDTATKGGDLGWDNSAYYTGEFKEACDDLKAGEVTDELVQTGSGWHIIKVIEKRTEKQRTYEEVKGQITDLLKQQAQAQAFNDYIEDLRKKAKIERTDDSTSKTKTKSGTK